jgi:hypothetical protein
MLNDAQRNHLRILMSRIEEKMRAIEFRLGHPDKNGLMSEIRNDITHEIAQVLREKLPEVYDLIRTLRDQLALPRESKQLSRELMMGLPQLWVVLQESDSKSLRRYGDVDHALAPVLDPQIETLARLMFELEHITRGDIPSVPRGIATHTRAR